MRVEVGAPPATDSQEPLLKQGHFNYGTGVK